MNIYYELNIKDKLSFKYDKMVDLNKLTVKYLEKLAEECRITFKKSINKPAKIKTILNAGIPSNKIENLFEKYLAEIKAKKKPSKVAKKKPESTATTKIAGRVKLLEDQVRFLMSKIDSVEIKIANLKTSNLIGTETDSLEIKNIIKSKILPGNSIAIDDLLDTRKLKKYSFEQIEKAIIDLIDDEIFDVSESSSKTKIEGNIGRLIRR